MKKLIVRLLLFTLLLLPLNSILASSGSISFFEALGNFGQLADYKLVQSFYGKLELEEFEDHVTADYRFTVSSVVDGDRVSSFNRVSAYFKFYNHNPVTDSTPFNEMTIQANGEVITNNQEDLYFKLTNFNVSMKEALPFAVLDIENVKAMINIYRGTWFHVSANTLAGGDTQEPGEVVDVEQYIEFEQQFKEEPKEAILGASQLLLTDSDTTFTEAGIEEILEGIGLALETKLFTERDVVAGRNTGFKFFNLNKGAIIGFFVSLGELIDEELSDEDISQLRSALSKISISGIYRIEEVYGIIDNLRVRFRLKEVELLQNLELNYRYKLSDLNKDNVIKTPSDYEEWSGL